jgi:hypothetical protein
MPGLVRGSHLAKVEHYSAPERIGEVYLSLLNHWDGTERFQVPLSVVPLIATTALHLAGRAGMAESRGGTHAVPRCGAR